MRVRASAAVRAVFDRVWRSFHAVRDEVVHSDSLQARRDFGPGTDSYRSSTNSTCIHTGRSTPRGRQPDELTRTSALAAAAHCGGGFICDLL